MDALDIAGLPFVNASLCACISFSFAFALLALLEADGGGGAPGRRAAFGVTIGGDIVVGVQILVSICLVPGPAFIPDPEVEVVTVIPLSRPRSSYPENAVSTPKPERPPGPARIVPASNCPIAGPVPCP